MDMFSNYANKIIILHTSGHCWQLCQQDNSSSILLDIFGNYVKSKKTLTLLYDFCNYTNKIRFLTLLDTFGNYANTIVILDASGHLWQFFQTKSTLWIFSALMSNEQKNDASRHFWQLPNKMRALTLLDLFGGYDNKAEAVTLLDILGNNASQKNN